MKYTIDKDGRAIPTKASVLRGGYRAGAGRKPAHEDGAATATLTVRVTDAQKAKVMALGGSEWVRQMINLARAPRSR